ncbi:O-antigen ligase family protein [Candidatus Parcubacteria bacterium]|nr:O-antigen ligase family protein [Candidatus Parcubacteria bacterium]
MNTILRRIILAGLFVVPFIPFFVSSSLFFPFITTKAFLWRAVVEIVFGAWVVLALASPEYRPRGSKLLWSLLIFIAIIGLADLFGAAPAKSFWSNFERMEGFVSLLHLGAFFVVIGSVFREREWRWWWNTSLIASVLMVFYCAFQLLGSVQIHQSGTRVDGTFGNAAYLAVYMLIHIFIALIYFIRTERGNFLRWVYGALLVGQVVILYYTATRGAILGLLGGLLLVALLNITNRESARIRKASIVVIVGFVILILGFFSIRHTSFVQKSPVLSRFASISSAELKTEGRSFIWPMAIEGIKERPLLGWGQENFNYVFDEHYSPKMFRLEPWFDRAHNIFLDWGVAGGLLGLLSYLALYAFFLWSVWKDASLTRLERSLLTGLMAAYFFHNFFVFDNLGSYILFAALLAYMHSRIGRASVLARTVTQTTVNIAMLPVALLTILALYFVNGKPLTANADLIKGLQASQGGAAGTSVAMNYLESAYKGSRLGRPETVEWVANSARNILSSDITTEEKNKYFEFAKKAVVGQATELPTDARYQLITGSFLSSTGYPDDALAYLTRAQKLMPGKQQVYFELANALIAKQDYKGALVYLKQAYEMAPEYTEAQVIYLTGAIYAGENALATSLIKDLPADTIAKDDRVANALFSTGKYADLVAILKQRLNLEPGNAQVYASLALAYAKAGDRASAIATLENLETKNLVPKDQVEGYIKDIKSGNF